MHCSEVPFQKLLFVLLYLLVEKGLIAKFVLCLLHLFLFFWLLLTTKKQKRKRKRGEETIRENTAPSLLCA